VKLIAVRSDKEAFKRRLLDGERAAPPEDCGGTPGYERMVHFVETGEDTYDDDPDGLAVWLDGWRPDAFDIARAKAEFVWSVAPPGHTDPTTGASTASPNNPITLSTAMRISSYALPRQS